MGHFLEETRHTNFEFLGPKCRFWQEKTTSEQEINTMSFFIVIFLKI